MSRVPRRSDLDSVSRSALGVVPIASRKQPRSAVVRPRERWSLSTRQSAGSPVKMATTYPGRRLIVAMNATRDPSGIPRKCRVVINVTHARGLCQPGDLLEPLRIVTASRQPRHRSTPLRSSPNRRDACSPAKNRSKLPARGPIQAGACPLRTVGELTGRGCRTRSAVDGPILGSIGLVQVLPRCLDRPPQLFRGIHPRDASTIGQSRFVDVAAPRSRSAIESGESQTMRAKTRATRHPRLRFARWNTSARVF